MRKKKRCKPDVIYAPTDLGSIYRLVKFMIEEPEHAYHKGRVRDGKGSEAIASAFLVNAMCDYVALRKGNAVVEIGGVE